MSLQKGSSLIEAMIALFILGIGMLGIFAMQARTSQSNHSTYYYSRAVMLANDMAENLRTTPSIADSYSLFFDDPTPDAKDCAGRENVCSPQEIKEWHIKNWRESIADQLPSGKSEIIANGTFITIKIQFDDIRGSVDKLQQELAEYVLVTEV
jgi:type IV pilus assembly protein PilV